MPDPSFQAFLFFSPGLRVRADARPRSARFPQGPHLRDRENTALEENDLGGLRHRPRLDCRGSRRGLPGKTLFASLLLSESLPGEESHTRHAPSERGRSWC